MKFEKDPCKSSEVIVGMVTQHNRIRLHVAKIDQMDGMRIPRLEHVRLDILDALNAMAQVILNALFVQVITIFSLIVINV